MPLRFSLAQRTILTQVGAFLSGTVVARAFGALALILIARTVGPQSYGQLAGSIAVLKLGAVLFSLGLDLWLLRQGGRVTALTELARHSTSCLVIKTGLGLLWLAALALVTPWLDPDAFPFGVVLLVALAVWFEELAAVAWTVFNSATRNQTSALLLALYQLLQLLIILFLVANGITSLYPYLFAQASAAALGAAISLYWMKRVFPFHLDWGDVRQAVTGSLPFGLSLALALIYGRADVAIIAHWLGSTATGIYAPAISLVMTVLLVPMAIYNVMLPLLSRAHAEHHANLNKRIVQLVLGSALLGMGMGAALALSAHALAYFIFGEKFQATGDILFVLSSVVVLRSISFALAAVITAVGWQGQRTLIQAVVAVANVGLNIWVVQQWGVAGVARVFVITELILLIGYLLLVVRWHNGPTKRVQGVYP